jgi:hypothetical protein
MTHSIRSLAQGPGAMKIYEAVVGADGKRRIARDNLGTLVVTAAGWELTIEGTTTTHASQAEALGYAAFLLEV